MGLQDVVVHLELDRAGVHLSEGWEHPGRRTRAARSKGPLEPPREHSSLGGKEPVLKGASLKKLEMTG